MKCNFENCNKVLLVQKTGNASRIFIEDAYKCTECAYVMFPPPTEGDLDLYYSNEYGKKSISWYNINADYDYNKVNSRANDIESLAHKYFKSTKGLTTLEIGCAFGGTVNELRNRGFNAYGADLNKDAIKQGRDFGNDYLFDEFAHLAMNRINAKANIIYAYHALEHITNLGVFLESLKETMTDDGILQFRVPNGAYLKAWLSGFTSWSWFAYPDHLHLLTPKSSLCLADSAGFAILDISSDACGESEEQVRQWMNLSKNDKIDINLIEVFENILAMQELTITLCLNDSPLINNFRDQINLVRNKCDYNANFEKFLGVIDQFR
jgi:SAM-dependent methyltransferase